MSTETRKINADRVRLPLAAAAALLALGGAFLLGQRTGGPAGPRPVAGENPGASSGEDAGEKGLVRFEEESLKLAGLRVEPVSARALQGHLEVTGTVEPNPGGVVRITPRVAGKITALAANVGDSVRAGQAVATLASTELAAPQVVRGKRDAPPCLPVRRLRRQRQLAGLGEFGRHKVEEARGADVGAQGEINTTLGELAAARNEVAEAKSERAAFEGEIASEEAEVAAARSEITEAQGQVRSLQAALAQAGTGVNVAQSKFNRYDRLLKEELVSKQDWEQTQADLQRAQSDVDAARANLAQGQAKVETAQGHLRAAQAKVEAARGRVEQAAAKIDSAQARQKQVEAKLEAARKRGVITAQSLNREEKIFRGGYLTSKEVVEAEAGLDQARAEQRAAADQIRLLGGTPGGGNTLTVTAPIGGRVTERTVTLGETVTPEKTLLTVVNLKTVWVQLAVRQRDLPSVRVGQPVTVTADTAPGRSFGGAVSSIGEQVDETTRTVKVRCGIQNPGDLLKPQAFVRGKIAAAVRTRALAVPKDAVQDLEGKRVVFVAADAPGEFRARTVEAGDTVDDQTIIASGLEEGDRVVTSGAFLVKAQAMKSELTEE